MAAYIQDTIRTLMAAHKNATFWTGEDFNLPDIDWDMTTIRIPSGSKQLHYAKAINTIQYNIKKLIKRHM